MSVLDEHMLVLAEHILSQQLGKGSSSSDLTVAIENTFSQLGELLSTVVGPVGFQALLERAAHLTAPKWPALDATRTPCFGDLNASTQRDGAAATRDGAILLLANVLDLLCNFIGESLTFRLVRRVWTSLPPRA